MVECNNNNNNDCNNKNNFTKEISQRGLLFNKCHWKSLLIKKIKENPIKESPNYVQYILNVSKL